MWTIIYLFPIILFILLLVFRIRSKHSYFSYKWTNAILYFLEVYIASLIIGSIYIYIDTGLIPCNSKLSLGNALSVFLTSFAVYEIIVLVTLNIFKSNNIDGYQSLKTLCDRLKFFKERGCFSDYNELIEQYKIQNGNTEHRVIPNDARIIFNKIYAIDFNSDELLPTLEYSCIKLDHLIQTESFSWNMSILLNMLK